MNSNLLELAQNFSFELQKSAKKDSFPVKSLEKRIDKEQKIYSTAKMECDRLQREYDALSRKLDEKKREVASCRKSLLANQRAMQLAQLSGAKAVMFHDDNDVSYVIDGKEHCVQLADDGEISLIPWREHIRNKRKESMPDDSVTDGTEVLEQDMGELDMADVDDLYSNLTE